jgi:hypothetical protein
MSGVAGAERVRSREDYIRFTGGYSKLIHQFCENNLLYSNDDANPIFFVSRNK